MTKIFITGSTGYIGGDAFYALYKAHPEFEYTLLVRNEARGKLVADKYPYPNVRFAYGDLDAADVIEREAAAADIVLHTADSSDNVPSAKAIAKGLAAGHSPSKPGYWIHICGTGILMWYDETNNRKGEAPLPEESYDDVADIDRIVSLPDQAYHRDVDKIVLAATAEAGGATGSVRAAIVGPPTIYGPGRGPVNGRSIQVYNMTKFALEKGFAPIVAPGLTQWDNVHVHDLSTLFVRLVDATANAAEAADPRIWGPKAYFFAENGRHLWADVARRVADEAARQGFLGEAATKELPLEEVPGGRTYGRNSISTATRARQLFGWKPVGRSLEDEIPAIVESEAKLLGLKAAGAQ